MDSFPLLEKTHWKIPLKVLQPRSKKFDKILLAIHRSQESYLERLGNNFSPDCL